MLIDNRKFLKPMHIPPRLHKDALLMSYEHQYKIRKIYNEVIGLNDIDHISINIVDPRGEMSIISYTPHIVHNIFSDGSYIYNGSISPTYYEKLKFYTWSQCYDKRFFEKTKISLEKKNGIEEGLVIVYKQLDFHILFSFASKRKNNNLLNAVVDNNANFFDIGFHCLDQIKNIHSQYYENNDILHIVKPCKIKPVCGLPNLFVIK